MIARYVVLITLFALLIVSGVGAQDAGAQGALQDITLPLTFVPNVQFANVYVAIEKGYFADEGINLSVEYLNEPDVVELIAAGQREFGTVSGEQVILARVGERPIVSVYEWFQAYPVGIVTPADSGIETVTDIAGRRVGIPGRFGASYTGLTAILAANGMTEADITLTEIGFNAPEVVCVGGVDAAVVYINNEPLQIQERCTDVRVFPLAETADLVSNGLVTSEALIADEPELVQSMVTAFDAGLRDAINNPAEAYLLSAAHIENLPLEDDFRTRLEAIAAAQDAFLATNPDREAIAESRQTMLSGLTMQEDFLGTEGLIQFQVLLNTIELWEAETLGWSDAASWESAQETMIAMGIIEAPIDVSAAFTNDFLPQ